MTDKKKLVEGFSKLFNKYAGWGEEVSLSYEETEKGEFVFIEHGTSHSVVDVTVDSGVALLRDVLASRYFR